MTGDFKAAVFLDRDGTIIQDRGHLSSVLDVIFINGSIEALKKLQRHFLLFMVTNQSGIAKGIIDHDDVKTVNDHMVKLLADEGIKIKKIYVCPHHSTDNCQCIKPKRYFLDDAIKNFKIDISRSFSIGDHPCDVKLAENAGGTGVYVLTGHGSKHRNEIENTTPIFENLNKATEWIIKKL